MAFQLEEINFRTVADPKGFIEECDRRVCKPREGRGGENH